MEISDFLIRLIFIGLPGIIGKQIYQKLRGRPVRKDWEDILEIVLFALGSYAIYGLITEILRRCCLGNTPAPLQALFDNGARISWFEIAWTSSIGIVLAFLSAYAHKRKWLNKLGQHFHVTKRFGDEDVWSLFLEQPKSDQWVFVRDYKKNLVYYGWIKAFSDSEKPRELILMDVQVFSDSPLKLLYEVESLYISRESDDLSIEIPLTNTVAKPQGETDEH